MFDYIEQLRKKPLAYRKRFLLIVTTSITGLIFLIWVSTFNFSFDQPVQSLEEEQSGPISEIASNISSFFTVIKKLGSEMFAGDATTSPDQKY
ncbi:MAG: hypothetical protein V4467_00675 [Patescibacteria group bacterium]